MTIRVGIAGYGNLGRGVELALRASPDMSTAAVFTRRDPASVTPLYESTPVVAWSELSEYHDRIDVLVLCGGSKSDLPEQGPQLAALFHTVDSFDTHAKIPEYFAAVDAVSQKAGTVALISSGWDPGLFSINRVMAEAVLPQGASYTFWGRGLSQGHSEAVRGVPGVADGVQYTLPSDDVLAEVRSGEQPDLAAHERHRRECFVVLEGGADAGEVERAIQIMPHYFADYDTTVHFISAEELAANHAAMPHGGTVMRSGKTSETAQVIEYTLKLGHNPEFTASVLVAYARAVHRMAQAGDQGAMTVFDVPPGLLSPKSASELRADYL